MTGQLIFPRFFRSIRPAGLAIGLLLSFLAVFDWLITVRLVVRQPLAIVPEAETWTPEMLAAALDGLGLPPGFYSAFSLSFSLLFSFAFLSCGWLILLRRGRDWFGLYLGLVLLIWADGVGVFYSVPPIVPWLQTVKEYLAWIGWPGLFLVLYFFPSGHVTPRWARGFAALLGGFILYGLIATAAGFEIFNVWVAFGIIIPILLVGGYAQLYRYRHAGPVERQQVKWVVLALLIYILFFISLALLINVLRIGDPGTSNLSTALLASMGLLAIGNLVYIGLPVSITLAMLRYRLWDVDLIIRRTLQYALLSGVLAMLYFGGVVVIQGVLGRFTGGSHSSLVTVMTTLMVAAIFNPLRIRIQVFIDRRFFRSKYNAEQSIEMFARLARDEVDMDRLIAAVFQVLMETVRPEKISAWMKPPEPARKHPARHSLKFRE